MSLPAVEVSADAAEEFDLDIHVLDSAPVADLKSPTEDGCGKTCQSACPATGC
jgi:FxLD family lantipeptide